MARPIEEILKDLKDIYGDHSEPVINAIETREKWRQIQQRFEELKQYHPYKECVRLLIREFHASESLVKKSIHKQFPDGS